MDHLKWIMSEGGPLIAMDSELQGYWGGVFRLTVASPGAENDYYRPPERLPYLQTINLTRGQALIFGEGPLDTAFWQSFSGLTFIIRIFYCEPEFDAGVLMTQLDQKIFDNPCETLHFEFFTSKIIMFDSAEDGAHPEIEIVTAKIEPGRYKILTQVYEPDELTSLLLHRLDKCV